LMVAPLLIAAAEALQSRARLAWREVARGLLVLAVAAAIAGLVFYSRSGVGFLFAIFPVLLLAAALLGGLGVKLTAALISAIGISAAFAGSGPFATGAVNEDLLHLQLFLSSVAIAALVLPAFRAAGSLLMAGGVLLVLWLLSGWLFASLHDDRLRADAVRFEMVVTEAEAGLRQRLATYEDALRGGAGLLTAAERVTRYQWQTYALSVNVPQRYPSVLGIGVIFPVRRTDEAMFLAETRADGDPDFAIREVPVSASNPPPSAPRDRYIITYIEPVAGNREAIGLDIASESLRRIAADEARDTGETQMTGRVTLVQDQRQRAGFLLLTPIYRAGAALGTSEERREALVAWIYSPFITEEFFQGVFGHRKEVRVSAFHGGEARAEARVYRSGEPLAMPEEFERVTRVALAGQTFTLGWNRGPNFVVAERSAAVWAATTMALISLLVAGLVMSLHVLARKAREIAANRTAELAASSARLKTLNAALEQKNTEVQSFAHTASHDLREPLRAVQGLSEVLLEDFRGQIPPEAQKMAERIRASAGRMAVLIDTLLAYAEVNGGSAGLRPVDLNEVLRVVLQDLEPRIDQVRGKIQQFGPLPVVSGDAALLRQLLQNLLGNALKFHRPGVPPLITIRTEPADEGENWATVSVADNGIGFAREHAERIFRPFDRLHGKTEFEGSGLGLAICRRVVERHGGQIYARGEPGVGATFLFTLPVAGTPETAERDNDDPASAASTGRPRKVFQRL
jgi:signal transduction histidine kinase